MLYLNQRAGGTGHGNGKGGADDTEMVLTRPVDRSRRVRRAHRGAGSVLKPSPRCARRALPPNAGDGVSASRARSYDRFLGLGADLFQRRSIAPLDAAFSNRLKVGHSEWLGAGQAAA